MLKYTKSLLLQLLFQVGAALYKGGEETDRDAEGENNAGNKNMQISTHGKCHDKSSHGAVLRYVHHISLLGEDWAVVIDIRDIDCEGQGGPPWIHCPIWGLYH